MEERRTAPDRLRMPAIIYLIGTIAIIGASYLFPRSYDLAFVIAIAVWGIGVPVFIFFYLRRHRNDQ